MAKPQPKAIPALDELKANKCKRDFKYFVKEFWHIVEPNVPFVDGYHLDAICEHLSSIEDIGNLLICLPPGFAKSLLVAVFFQTWWWTKQPADRFVYASYALSLSERDSMKCRKIIASELYQRYFKNTFTVLENQDTKKKFENDKSGFRLATSVDAGVTGERGNFAIVDDPHNVQETKSKKEVESVCWWYANSFSNRITPHRGHRIVVLQRLLSNDLAGSILKNDKENHWHKLILPVEFGRCPYVSTRWKDPRTVEGELLCPELLSKKKIEEQKSVSGKSFEAQYNQSPSDADTCFNLDDIQYYDQLPSSTEKIRIGAVDLAISMKGDYTVVAIADVYNTGEIYFVHVHRERIPGIKITPTISIINETYNPKIIYVEDVAFQRLVIEECRYQRMPVLGVRPEGSKEARAELFGKKLEAHQIFFPKNKAWCEEARAEMELFPYATHDDFVDCAAYICLKGQEMQRRMKPPELPTVPETAEETQLRLNKEWNEKMFGDLIIAKPNTNIPSQSI